MGCRALPVQAQGQLDVQSVVVQCGELECYKALSDTKLVFQVRCAIRRYTSSLGYMTKLGMVRDTSAFSCVSAMGLPDIVSALMSNSLRQRIRNTLVSYKASSRPLHY